MHRRVCAPTHVHITPQPTRSNVNIKGSREGEDFSQKNSVSALWNAVFGTNEHPPNFDCERAIIKIQSNFEKII